MSGDGGGGDSGEPGHPIEVTGTFERELVRLDASQNPMVITGPIIPDHILSSTVTFADGTSAAVEIDAAGAFSFTSPDNTQPYTLVIVTKLSTQVYQLTQPTLSLFERIGGRDSRKAIPANTTVHVSFTSGSPTTNVNAHVEMLTTGIWTRTVLTVGMLTNSFAWSDVLPQSGPQGLLEGNNADAAYYAEYVPQSASYYRIGQYGYQRLAALTGGSSNAMPFALVPAPMDQCAMPMPQEAAEIARLTAETTNVTSAASTWGVLAVPALELSLDASLPLAFRTSFGTPVALPATVQYGNPFMGEQQVAAMQVAVDGTYDYETQLYVPLATNCAATPIPAESLKVASMILVNAEELTSDTQQLHAGDTGRVVVSWTPSAAGQAHYYQIGLVELVANGIVGRASVTTTSAKATFDGALFAPGHLYRIVIDSHLGAPDAATGDFSASGPVGYGRTISTSFQF